jgi:hypothetical protein
MIYAPMKFRKRASSAKDLSAIILSSVLGQMYALASALLALLNWILIELDAVIYSNVVY